MYGGDEVGALVLDVGTSTVKFGFAGEGLPKVVMPTTTGVKFIQGDSNTVGNAPQTIGDDMAEDFKASSSSASSSAAKGKRRQFYVGDDAAYRRDGMEITRPVQHGVVTDWDAMEHILDHAIKKQLFVDPKEHPFIIASRAFDTRERRELILEMMFEKLDTPAVFLGQSPVLAAFAMGKSTALVVDSGGGLTSCVPVHEGYALHKGSKKTNNAGDTLDATVQKLLFGSSSSDDPKRPGLKPRYLVDRQSVQGATKFTTLSFPNTTESFHRYACLDVIRDIKESVCRVSESAFDPATHQSIPKVEYELPDGNVLEVGTDRFMATEPIFSGNFEVNEDVDPNFKFEGLPKMVQTCVDLCDVDIRRELFGTVCLTGGSTLFPGYPERLQRELNTLAPPALKAKVHLPYTKLERRFGVWVGGSILASLGTFHQMWLSKSEYNEHGPALLAKKCP